LRTKTLATVLRKEYLILPQPGPLGNPWMTSPPQLRLKELVVHRKKKTFRTR
jgi:hypothetical protein